MKNISSLIQVSQSYERLFNKLKNLEIEGKYNSDEYKENISYLKDVQWAFIHELKSYKLNYKDLVEIEEMLANLYGVSDCFDIISHFLKLEPTEYYKKVYSILLDYTLANNLSDINDEANKELKKIENIRDFSFMFVDIDGFYEKVNKAHQMLKNENFVLLTRQNYFINSYIEKLMKEIDDPLNFQIKNDLISAKYNFIFLFNNLCSNFTKDHNNFVKTQVYKDLVDVTYEQYKPYYKDYFDKQNYALIRKSLSTLYKYGTKSVISLHELAIIKLHQINIDTLIGMTQSLEFKQMILSDAAELIKDSKGINTKLLVKGAFKSEINLN